MFKFIEKLKIVDQTRMLQFLDFYSQLVTSVDKSFAVQFGRLSVKTAANQDWGIELSVQDYHWWVDQLAKGVRFKAGFEEITEQMLHKALGIVEKYCDTSEERKELLEQIHQVKTNVRKL